MKFSIIFTVIICCLLSFVSCSTGEKVTNIYDYKTNIKELYFQENQLDSNSLKYVKNKYLIDLLVNASKNEQLGFYHQTIIDLLDAYRFDTSKVILFALARNFYQIEKYSLAFDYAFKSFLLDSNFVPTIELLVLILYKRGKYNDALYFSNKVLQIKGNNVSEDNLTYHISILDKLDRSYNQTISFLKTIDNPNLEDFVNRELIYYYYLIGDTTNQNLILEKIFSKPVKLKEKIWIYSEVYFTNLLERREFDKAVSKFKELLKFSSLKDALKITELFISKIKEIDSTKKELVDSLCQIFDLNFPNNILFQYQILRIYSILRDTTKTYNQCKVILNNENIDLEILVNTSYVLYFDLKKKNEAIQKLNSYKYKFFDSPTYFNVLGELYAFNEQYQLAEEMFKKSLNLDSSNYEVYNNLAWIYSEIEDWSKSDYYYSKSIEIFPNNPVTLNNYAYSLIVRDTNLPYARVLIEKAISIRPDDSNFLDTYGWYFFRIGDYEKAKYYIEKSIELDDTRPEPFLHLSLIYKKLGDFSNAQYFLEKALSIDPNNKEILKELEKEQNKR